MKEIPDEIEKAMIDDAIKAYDDMNRAQFAFPKKMAKTKAKAKAQSNKGFKKTIPVNEKVEFINSILDFSLKKNIDNKTKDRIFSVISKEIDKSGSIDNQILDRLSNIEKKLSIENKPKLISHNPKHVANFMALFNDRDGLKYLTHDYEDVGEFIYSDFMVKSKLIFKLKTQEYRIPKKLWQIVNQFAFVNDPKWTTFDNNYKYKQIKSGWSSEIWKKWVEKSKNHPSKNPEFSKIISEFRKLTRIEPPTLKSLIDSILHEVFVNPHPDYIESINGVKLSKIEKADFYTHTPSLREALLSIFKQIKKFDTSKKFSISYERDTSENYFIRKLIIKHYQSFPDKDFDVLKTEWNSSKGSMGSIRDNLMGFCNWSVETNFDNKYVRVNILKEETTPEVEYINSSDVDGFKHILTFYYR